MVSGLGWLFTGQFATFTPPNQHAGCAVLGAIFKFSRESMAIFKMDLGGELDQIKEALDEVVKQSLTPAIDQAIDKTSNNLVEVIDQGIDKAGENLNAAIRTASSELNDVVKGASQEIEASIDKLSQAINQSLGNLSQELNSQRQMTREDVQSLIDYASAKLVKTLVMVGVLSCIFMSAMAYLMITLLR